MFNNTRRRLVILNAAVFLLLLSILSSLLYVHMRYRLFHDTDEILNQAEHRIQSFHNISELLRSDHPDPQQDERTTYLFWDAQGQLIEQVPKQSFSLGIASQFRNHPDAQTVRTVTTDKHSYRVLQFPNQNQSSSTIASIGIVRSLEDVKGTLRSLMLDIAVGIVAGVIISIFAGLFLAERALVPIRRSWEKQQRFVADASHELRTPTAVIHAQTELLFRHPTHSIEQESPNIAVILKESKRMGKLVEDLLTLARSDSNQLQIQSSTIALDSLLSEVIDQFRLLADTQEIEIITDLHPPLTLWGDEGRIRQLLIILLDNALKYTPSSGRIEVSGRYQSNSVYISILDTGCGIAEDELPHIFERFYRGDKVRSRTQGGTGLGLSIAQWIVDAHGGVIRVHSKVNTGTKVELLFPRKHRGQAETGGLGKV
jgi:two-component system sensor histidine kinase CiaH